VSSLFCLRVYVAVRAFLTVVGLWCIDPQAGAMVMQRG
jgi:hypothetical protein